jgi:hypothetical protein
LLLLFWDARLRFGTLLDFTLFFFLDDGIFATPEYSSSVDSSSTVFTIAFREYAIDELF